MYTLVFWLLVAITLFAIVAKKLRVPYPIAFVIGGAILGLIPGLPSVQLDPNLVFLIFLPPLLTAASWTTDVRAFWHERRAIGLLSIGLVITTTVVVGATAHELMKIPWASAFALGAIVAPTDAIAMEALAEQISVPRRLLTILSGESLVNDATALVIYRFAIAAAGTGAFSLLAATGEFFVVSFGGIATGLVLAYALELLQSWLNRMELSDSLLDNVLLLLMPFAAYLPAEALGFSGVLATVTCGLYLSNRWSVLYSAESRLVGTSVWEILTFILNGAVFIILGLQLRGIVLGATAAGTISARGLIFEGLIIAVVTIVVRFVWVYPATYLPRLLFPKIRAIDPYPPWQYPFVISWSGMRGIVSLAAALAVPLVDASGRPFAARSEIIFDTFCVIFATLVFQGLTIAPLLRVLKIRDDGTIEAKEIEIRIKALKAGVGRLREIEPTFDTITEWEVEGRIIAEYQHRIEHLQGERDDSAEEAGVSRVDHRLQKEALDAERSKILSMRRAGQIPDQIYRSIERDLDLAEQRLR